MGIERVAGIDHHAKFSAAGGGGQSGQEQGGASRGSGTADFGQASAGQATGQGVDGGDAAGNHFRGWTNIETRSRSYMGQPGVGRGKLGRADALRRTTLQMPLARFKGQRHFRNCLSIKDKRAAQGRRSGNHCGRHKIPRKISGNAGLEPRKQVRFLFAYKSLLRELRFVKREA